jgi:adenylate cyclase
MADAAVKNSSPAASGVVRQRRILGASVIGGLLAGFAGFCLHDFPFGASLRRTSYDLSHILRGEIRPKEAVVILLDDESHTQLGQDPGTAWSRALHAKLVDRLTSSGAKAVVFDIVFNHANSDSADEQFSTAIRRNGQIALAADAIPSGGMTKLVPPFDLLLTNAATIGSAEKIPDPDLIIRRHTPRGDSPVSTLPWTVAELVGAQITTKPEAESQPRWLSYYGRPGIVRSWSYYQALDPALVSSSEFSNKVVFVGARIITKFAGERKDEYPHPFTPLDWRRRFMSGVEIQATEFLNLLRGDWLNKLSDVAELSILIGFGVAFGAGIIFLRPTRAVMAAIACCAAIVGTFHLIFVHQRIWFPWLILIVQIGAGLSWSVLFNSIQLYVQKRLLEHTIGLYLSPKLVSKFASSPAMLRPGAHKHTLTFLFTDIANFTTISERMDGDELAAMMNDYFQGAVGGCIHKTDGTVVKFIGDAIFAFWNAPEPQPDHAVRACKAALLFRDQSKLPVRGRNLYTRLGLHTGEARVGNFGSAERIDYTAVGESVNLASRLEGLNKHLGTDCLISGATKAEIGDQFVTRKLGEFQLKGFAGFVQVHELVAFPEQSEPTKHWREAFEEALTNYEQRNLEFAAMGFKRVLELKPDDGPASFYLDRIAELSRQQLPEAWATQTVIKEK